MLPADTPPVLAAVLLLSPGVCAAVVVYVLVYLFAAAVKRSVAPLPRATMLAAPPAVLVVTAVLQVGSVHRVLLWAVAGYALASAMLGALEAMLRFRST